MFKTLIGYLSEDNCPIQNLFLDWNPLYKDSYVPGNTSVSQDDQLYQISGSTEEDQSEEISLFAKLISDAKKLQVIFLRACSLNDKDLEHIMLALKPETQLPMNRNLKVLDLSYNKFSGEALQGFKSVFEQNRSLEFLGLAKNNLTTEQVTPLLTCFGKVPLPADQADQYQAELKRRDTIVEKNKKLKQQKKPEEPVPILDQLETQVSKDADGNDVTNYFLLKCPQFKHLNLCMNKLDDESMPAIERVLSQTPDDFGITLSGNPISQGVVKHIH